MGPQQAGISAAGTALQERLASLMCSRVLGCLAAVMSRAKLLAPREQACPYNCPEQVQLDVADAACGCIYTCVLAWPALYMCKGRCLTYAVSCRSV